MSESRAGGPAKAAQDFLRVRKPVAVALFAVLGAAVLSFALVGSSAARKADSQANAAPIEPELVQEMIGFRFSSSDPPLAEEDPGTKLSYLVNADGMFHGTVEIHNLRPVSHDYTVVVFVDYEQAQVVLEGERALMHAFSLESEMIRWLEFDVGPMSPGWHDLSVVAFTDLDEHELSLQDRWKTGEFGIVSARANVLVPGSSAIPTPLDRDEPVAINQVVGPDGSELPGARIDHPLVNDVLADYVVVTELEAKADATVLCYLHVANNTESIQTHAIVPTIDGVQVLGADGAPIVIHTAVAPGDIQTFEVELAAPDTVGTHELQFLDSINPFSTLTDETFGDSQMLESIRIALIVR